MPNRTLSLTDAEDATLVRATAEYNLTTGESRTAAGFLLMLVRHRIRGFATIHARADRSDDASALARALADPVDGAAVEAILERHRLEPARTRRE